MSSWEQFFARHRDYSVEVTFYGCKDHFTLDELYEAFKARMLAEAAEAATETPLPANARVIATCDLSTTAQETEVAPPEDKLCASCGHFESYHFDNGKGAIRCRKTRDCDCSRPTSNRRV